MSVFKTEVAVGEWEDRANLTYVPCNARISEYGHVDAVGRKVAVGGGGDITRRPYLVDTGETVTYIKYDTGVSPIFKVTEEGGEEEDDGEVDPSDATATAGDILADKTAYVGSGKVTGTIQSKAAQTYTPTTSNQTIAAGQYLTGAQTIAGDANLLAGNIKDGVSIFGVTGAYSINFYRRASVDTTNHTWTGYKLIPNAANGYEFESTASAVGEYSVMPEEDGIYDATGKLRLKSFYRGDNYDPYGEGLLYSIFVDGGTGVSAPLEGIVTTDNYTSNVETVDGITARKFTGNLRQKVTTTAGTSRSIFSASVWIKAENNYAIGGTSNIMRLQFRGWTEAEFQYSGSGNLCTIYPPNSNWHYYTVTCDGTSYKVYFDTELKGTVNSLTAFPDTAAGLCFGHDGITSTEGVYYFSGYIANFRFYDHVLTSSEIAALYEELTPSNS